MSMNWLYELDMGKVAREQVNANTILLLLVGALLTLYVNKADRAFSKIIELETEQHDMDRRVSNIESELGIATPIIVRHPPTK